ncbi:MAG: hypothetical protein HKP58_04875, partial [Desulfatitalea sp.]|nr:hypothetical protein [Desulfatitalea sp.]NNJ99726.1 hypothetical protein [Desulfatitalea sp.]
FDDHRYLPFEGAGAISSWRIDMHQSNNVIDLSRLTDVVLSLCYTAKSGGTPLEIVARANWEKGLAQSDQMPSPQYRMSLRHEQPGLWKQLQAVKANQDVELKLPLSRALLPGRFLEFDLRTARVTVYAHSRHQMADTALRVQIAPPDGAAGQVTGWTRPWASSHTLRANTEIKGGPGTWTLTVGTGDAKVPELLEDVVLIFDFRAKRARR